MDSYGCFEQDLSNEHDYQVCMADCPSGMKCNCSGSGDDSGVWPILGLTVLLIVGFVMIFI